MPTRAVTVVLTATLCITSSALALDKLQSALEQPGGATGTTPPPLTGPFSTAWVRAAAARSTRPASTMSRCPSSAAVRPSRISVESLTRSSPTVTVAPPDTPRGEA